MAASASTGTASKEQRRRERERGGGDFSARRSKGKGAGGSGGGGGGSGSVGGVGGFSESHPRSQKEAGLKWQGEQVGERSSGGDVVSSPSGGSNGDHYRAATAATEKRPRRSGGSGGSGVDPPGSTGGKSKTKASATPLSLQGQAKGADIGTTLTMTAAAAAGTVNINKTINRETTIVNITHRQPPPSRQELRKLTSGTEVEERRTLAALRDLEACLEESKVAAAAAAATAAAPTAVSEKESDQEATTLQEQQQESKSSSAGGGGASTAAVAAAAAAAAGALPVELAAALGLTVGKSSSCKVGVNGQGNSVGGGDARAGPGAGDNFSPHVDLVRQARASVEFRVARRNYRHDLEHAASLAYSDSPALKDTLRAKTARGVSVSGGEPATAGGPAGGATGGSSGPSQMPSGTTTDRADISSARGLSARSKAVAAAVAAAVATAKGPSGLRTRVLTDAPVTHLFRARVDAAPGGGPKSSREKEIARVMRENQARALAAQADLDGPLRARFVPSAATSPARTEVAEVPAAAPASEKKEEPATTTLAAVEAAAVAAVTRSTFEIHAARLRELKPLMTRAIRRRRLALRRRWEQLGEQYAGLHNAWQDDMVRWEEKMEEDEAKEAAATSGGAGEGDDGEWTGTGSGVGVGGSGGGGGSSGNGGLGAAIGSSLRSERRGGRRLSDVVRSDYEEAEVVKKFEDKHKEEERIRKGAVEVPSMLTAVERRQLPEYRDSWNSRGTTDGLPARCRGLPAGVACPAGCNCPAVVETERKRSNLWTDVEKCIFLDKFLHHPKNFMRISSFLPRKSPEDVVQFYYDSKTSIDYKTLLKEAVNRNKVHESAMILITKILCMMANTEHVLAACRV